jgi:beta-phosphoglucomutase
MSLPKACIFDLDGVIVDTVEAHFIAWKSMADELNIPFTKEDNEHLKGISRNESMKIILGMGGLKKSDEEISQYTTKKNEIYVDIISKMTPKDILPGVLDFIELLKTNGIAIAIGSSSKNTPTILKAVGLDSIFDVVVDGNQVTHSKPDPEVFLKGAIKLNMLPKDCVVLEDAISGVEAAKRGGMKCIGVGESNVLGAADIVVADLTKLDLAILKSL